jgi:hypothetical protein
MKIGRGEGQTSQAKKLLPNSLDRKRQKAGKAYSRWGRGCEEWRRRFEDWNVGYGGWRRDEHTVG